MKYSQAGFGLRFFADIIDFLLVGLPVTFLITFLAGGFGNYYPETSWAFHLVYMVYLTLLPLVWNGYVVGKRMLKIRIMRVDDQPLTLMNMILREVVGKVLLSSVTFGISSLVSLFMVLIREDKRAVHDFIGGTYVGYEY